MSDIWDGAYWDEDGVLHIDIFPMQPVKQDEDDTMYEDEEYEEITKRLTFVVTKVEDRRIIEAKLFIEVVLDEDELDDGEKDE